MLEAGNTNDCKTLRMFLDKIEKQYGRARRVWVMDRGIPTEPVLAEMRASDPPVQYLVGTPKGRTSLVWKKQLLDKPWQQAREGVAGSNCWQTTVNFSVFAQSDDPRRRKGTCDAQAANCRNGCGSAYES